MAKTSKKKANTNPFKQFIQSTTGRVLLIGGAAALAAILSFQASASKPVYFSPTADTTRQALAAFVYRTQSQAQNRSNNPCIKGKAGPFKDVSPTHQFCNEIAAATSSKVLSGYSDGTFRPTAPVARQLAAVALYRLDGSPAYPAQVNVACKADAGTGSSARTSLVNQGRAFKDVDYKHTFCKEITYAAVKGYLAGFSDKTFKPTQTISRQHMAVALHNRAGKPGPQARDNRSGFVDVDKNHQFFTAIKWMGEKNISIGSPKPLK